MANPLKILTVLTASKAVEMAETLKVAGNADFDAQVTASSLLVENGARVEGVLTVANDVSASGKFDLAGALNVDGATDLDGALDVAGAVTMQSTLSASGQVDFAGALNVDGAVDFDGALDVAGAVTMQSTLSASGQVDFAGALNVDGATDLDGALDVAGAVTMQSTLSASGQVDFAGALNVDGAADFDSTIDVAGNATFQATASITGDLNVDGATDLNGALDVAGAANFQSNVTIAGDLTVNGTTTSINTNDLLVEDSKIVIANGASGAALQAAGIYLANEAAPSASIIWDQAGYEWEIRGTVAGDYLSKVNMGIARISSANALEPTGLYGGNSLRVGYGFSSVEAYSTFYARTDAVMSGSLKLSGSAFSSAAVISASQRNADGLYDVDAVLHALETSAAGASTAIKDSYNAVRYAETGSFDASGVALVNLTTQATSENGAAGGLAFATINLPKIAVDVLISTDAGSTWTNDLVAVQLTVSGASLVVQIDAPAVVGNASARYRLIAVNEGDLS